MAYTYANAPVLSKIKVGDNYYYMKDADARAILDTFNNAIVTGTIAANASEGNTTDLVTLGVVKDYVNAQVGVINKFDVEVASADKILTTPTADDMYILYLVPAENAAAGSYVEYIVLRSGTEGNYTYAWEQIGNTTIDLTGYLSTDATVAGVKFTNGNVPATALKTALDLDSLGAFAKADTGTATVVNGVEDHSYQPAGSVSVVPGSTTATVTSSGTYTPAGNITGSVVASGNVSAAKNNESGAFQLSGSVAAPTISVVLSNDNFVKTADAGSLPSFTEGAFTAATLTYSNSNFATNGSVASVGIGEDAETLIFTAANTSSASNITAFNGGSKAADTFSAGTLPTFTTGSAAIGVTSATATAPSFTGDKFDFTFIGTAATVSANFEGTAATINVSGNYDKTTIESASFTGTTATLSHNVTTGAVTVTPATK